AGVDRLLPGHAISPDELDACAKAQGCSPGPGDVLLVRTGWVTQFAIDSEVYFGPQPGLDATTVPWLVERDLAAVGADNVAVERFPDAGGANVPLHKRLLRDYGVHLIELLDLEELAAARIWEFLFVAAPLRIKRGVG